MSKEKVVLAYSGGLDTSVCVKWLQDEKNLDVVCVCGNVGQEETGLDAKKQKALDLGVLDCQVLDLRDEFSDEFLTKAIAANSMYENKYPLLSALSRPLLAKKLVEVAHEFGATYVAHGCTGKGNDQVRFEAAVKALDHMGFSSSLSREAGPPPRTSSPAGAPSLPNSSTVQPVAASVFSALPICNPSKSVILISFIAIGISPFQSGRILFIL